MSQGQGPHESLRALQRDYVGRLPDRVAELARRLAALRDAWVVSEAVEMQRLAHNLAGSGASYGFPAVSTTARQVERALDALLERNSAPPPDGLDAVALALAALDAAIARAKPADAPAE